MPIPSPEHSMDQSRRIKGIIIQIISEVMFGLSFMFTKEATNSTTPLQLLSWRFTLAAVLFLVLIKLGFFKVSFLGKNLISYKSVVNSQWNS